MARKRLSFEKTLASLEQVVEQLESGNLTLDEALDRYERGMAAYKECSDILSAAEKRIEVLVKRADAQFETAPFATGDGEPAGAAEAPPCIPPSTGGPRGAADQDAGPAEKDDDCPF